ncbi:EVE domain-containing protein [uncultured Sphingomonas sp.]|uniref:EVE domain-containing protein n=1 Tax=uncultured Sphingomonas sp. TaxID=158754 RepID=UPI0025DAC1AE|nr:EVE domain-containing protein [uncultured Sphingomonas sp.]
MKHWILKSEPAAYSWDDLVREGATEWTGVRNHAAAANLRAMEVGDEGLLYHSVTGLEAVGIVRIARVAAPDPTDDKWVSVEIWPVRPLVHPVTLKAMKAEERLAGLCMIRQSRLSVSPVSDAEWAVILEMSA